METKFTKGEWRVEYNGSWYQIVAIEKNDRDWIADTCASSCRGDLALGEANAHLIAAAPDMYKFLESLQLDVTNDYKRDELLAKARGEL